MNLGAGRTFGLAVATLAVAFGIATEASAAKLPKFKVLEASNPPASVDQGDSFSVDGTVKNAGRKAGEATVRVSLRSDNVEEEGSIVLGETETGKVKKGETAPFGLEATVPEDATPGTYYMVTCATPAKGSGCFVSPNQVTIEEPSPPVFTAGSRGTDDDIYPQTGNGGYDATHYDIDLIYDPATNLFETGTKTTMTATTTQNLSEFTMDFQDVGVTGVTIDGVPVDGFSFATAEPALTPPATVLTKLVIDPAGPGILAGEEIDVEVAYAGEPKLITDPDESWEGWIPACYTDVVEICDGAFTVNEPNGTNGWFPSNNYPTDKATFDTSITVPDGVEAAGMGELVSNPDNPDDTETWNWSEDDPTSTYLATATNGQFDYTTPSITENLTGRTIPQNNFVEATATPTEQASIATALGRTEAMHNWLADRFGTYPYDSNGVVADRVPGVCYALENATKSHFAGNCSTGAPGVSQSTLVHEISHQWMGNAVTLKEWDDIWFQEGWAQWVSWAWNFTDNVGTPPKSPGEQFSENYTSGQPSTTKWDTIPTELNDSPEDLFATFPTYTRGAMTYEGYRQIVGTPKFFEFARELQDRFKYDNVSSEQVVDLMIEVSDFEGARLALLEDYFDQWLYQAGRPTITPEDFN
jgi:aminopeptidase N